MNKSFTLKLITVASMGFFSILVQTLLFRYYLIVFDGNELTIGIFFFSWLTWICIGAHIARLKIVHNLSFFYPCLLLLYIPFFIVQFLLFIFAENILGANFYDIIPLGRIIIFTSFANAPVSFLSGFLFVIAADWIKADNINVPVIKIYMAETFGSFIGALLVTFLLYFSFVDEFVASIGILILFLAVSPHIIFFGKHLIILLYLIFTTVCIYLIVTGYPVALNEKIDREKWGDLVVDGKYFGDFSTPQSKYIYGEYKGELVVTSSNSVYETFPNYNAACNAVGEYLAQAVKSKNILIIGPGTFSICNVISKINPVKKVTWLESDPDYPKNFVKILKQRNKEVDLSKISIPCEDARKFVAGTESKFDFIILDLPPPSNLLLSRYFSFEFFKNLKSILSDDGVIAVKFPGGENFLGTELSLLGSSILYTLQNVFYNIVLKPGAESVFFVSDKKGIVTESGDILYGRLKENSSIQDIYSIEHIKSVYKKDRIDYQMSIYKGIIEKYPERILFSSDKSPKSFFYSLLLSIKTLSNISFKQSYILKLCNLTLFIVILTVSLYFILRIFYFFAYSKTEVYKNIIGKNIPCKFDIYVSVFIAAMVGMGLNLMLLFMFQINFGTVYLCFGLITAFFMLGMAVSTCFIEQMLKRISSRILFYIVSLLFTIDIFIIYIFPPFSSILYFSVLFFLAGFFCGAYFPLSVFFLKQYNRSDINTASGLGFADNIGGAAGSIIFSILLLPVIGLNYTLGILFLFLCVILFHIMFIRKTLFSSSKDEFSLLLKRSIRFFGFLLFGIAVFFIIFNLYITRLHKDNKKVDEFSISKNVLVELAGADCNVQLKIAKFNNNDVNYYVVKSDDGRDILGYIFRTKDFGGSVTGYAGPIDLASYVNTNGEVKDFTILDSNETPLYQNEVLKRKNIFLGQNVFANDNYEINAVTGATYTSKAISKLLYNSGQNFYSSLREQGLFFLQEEVSDTSIIIVLLFLIMVSIIVFYRLFYFKMISAKSRTYFRIIILLFSLILFGFFYNIQFSSGQILSLVSGNIYLKYLNVYTLMCIGIPVLVILSGNIYCGYLCPFGAFQEILFNIATKLKINCFINNTKIYPLVWIVIRTLKYFLLFFIIIVFIASSGDKEISRVDILTNLFSMKFESIALYPVLLIIIVSMFFKRFWCRVLCPSGAFLSILNGIHFVFKRKNISVQRCDLGVTGKNDFDCICCDKCYSGKRNKKDISKANNLILLFLSILIFSFLLFEVFKFMENSITVKPVLGENIQSERAVEQKKESEVKYSKPVNPIGPKGKSRRIDINKYTENIKKGYLSNHEAQYYRKIKDNLTFEFKNAR